MRNDEQFIAFIILFFATLIGTLIFMSMDAKANNQINEVDINSGSVIQYQDHWVRGTDNYLYHVYSGSQTDIMISWSSDGGSVWTEHTIFDSTWRSQTSGRVFGIVISSNGTIFVAFYLYDGSDGTHVTYLARHYPGDALTTGWDSITLSSHSTHSLANCDVVIDRNDRVWVWGPYNLDIRYAWYDMDLDTTDGPTVWVSGAANLNPSVVYDMNGDMWITYIYSSVMYTKDFAQSLTFSKSLSSSYVWGYSVASTTTSGTGTDARLCHWLSGWRSATSYSWGIYLYESTDNTTYTESRIYLTNTRRYSNICSIGIDADNDVFVQSYAETNGLDNVYQWTSDWDGDAASFQATERTIYTIPDDDDYMYLCAGSTARYPRSGGYAAAIPTNGYFQSWIWKDEQGATDDYSRSVNWSATWHSFPVNPPPTITTASLPDGTIDTAYSKTLSATDGDLPYTWSLVTAPVWLNIGSSNGTLWGTPPATGSFTVTARVSDVHSRTDDETWTLTINPEPSDPGRTLDFPVSVDTLAGALWWLFMFMAMSIAIIDAVMTVRKKKSKGPF